MKLASILTVAALAAEAIAATPTPPTPGVPTVTQHDVLRQERFWPYRVALTRPFSPGEGKRELRTGARGVLVRLEDSHAARIDFGRDGRFPVPIVATDLIERANRVARGELKKVAPNFVHAIGTRLLDAAANEPRPIALERLLEPEGFLAVFAKPEELEQLASSLAALHKRHGVWTVLFLQGRIPDEVLWKQLRELDWEIPFLLDQYGEGYTRSILGEAPVRATVMLQTPEGRVLFQSQVDATTSDELERAIEGGFVRP